MFATFLGTADGHTSRRRAHSGIILKLTDSTLLLDCGANTAQFLLAHKFSADEPGMIWLSHMHSDHVGQFPMLIQSLWLRGRTTALHIFAPKKAVSVLQNYLQSCLLFPELLGFPLIWHAVTAGRRYPWEDMVMTAIPTTHLQSLASRYRRDYPATCYDCFGLQLELEGTRIVYSSDLGAPSDLARCLDQPIRTLICEISHFPEASLFEELAKGQGIGQTLVTHFPDQMARREKELQALAKSHGLQTKLQLLTDGQTIAV